MSLHLLPTTIDYEAWSRQDYVHDHIDLDQLESELDLIVRDEIPDRMKLGGMLTVGELR